MDISSYNSASMRTLTVERDRPPHLGGDNSSEEESFKVYRYRWLILLLFCLSEAANALMWVTFSPISNIAQDYFGHGYYGSTTSVNMLANIFLILYGPGTMLSVYCMKHLKLKSTLVLAGSLTLLGAFIRFMAAMNNSALGHGDAYILMVLGQALAALAQPMYLNSPPALSSVWFPVSERDTATTIGAMCSPIGNAIGQVIPVLLVSARRPSGDVDDDSYDSVRGMSDLMLVELVMCILPLALIVVLFQDAPPTPPSKSTQLKSDVARQKASIHESSTPTSELDSQLLKDDLYKLAGSKDYLVLFCAFSIGVGFFNSLMTLLNQLIAPFGYSNNDAGTFGAVFIVFGLMGAGTAGQLMEKTRAYRTILKAGVGLCVFTTLFLVAMLFADNYWPLLVAFALLGLSILPLLPVMMENCAECTYPIPEDFSMGVMFVGSNVLGLGFIFGLQFLIDAPAFGQPPLLPSNVFIVAIITAAAIIVCFYHGEYKRLERESLLDNRLYEDSSSSSLLSPLTGYLTTGLPSMSASRAPTTATFPAGISGPSNIRVTATDGDHFNMHIGGGGSKNDADFISASSSINIWAHNSQATSHNHSMGGTYSQSKLRHSGMNPIQVLVNAVDVDRSSISSEDSNHTTRQN